MRTSIRIIPTALAILLAGCTSPTPSAAPGSPPAPGSPAAPPSQDATAAPQPTVTTVLTAVPTATPPPDLEPWSPSQAEHASLLSRLGFSSPADAAWSPDGQVMAIANYTSIRLYDAHSFRFLRSIAYGALKIAFSPDGRTLAVGTRSGVSLWDIQTNTRLSGIPTTGSVITLAYMPDGKSIITGTGLNDGLNNWDVATGQLIRNFKQNDSVSFVTASPDGTQFAVAYKTAGTFCWGMTSGAPLCSFASPSHQISAMAYGPDGSQLVIPDWGDLHIVDPHTGQLTKKLAGASRSTAVTAVAYSPLGHVIAAGNLKSEIVLWDVDKGAVIQTIPAEHGNVESLRFSPDGAALMTLYEDGTFKLLDATTGTSLRDLDGDTEGIFSLAFSPDNKYLFTGERLGAVRMWDISTGQLVRDFRENMISPGQLADVIESLAVSPDGSLLAAAHSKRCYRVE